VISFPQPTDQAFPIPPFAKGEWGEADAISTQDSQPVLLPALVLPPVPVRVPVLPPVLVLPSVLLLLVPLPVRLLA
jgi:hypothetical protein